MKVYYVNLYYADYNRCESEKELWSHFYLLALIKYVFLKWYYKKPINSNWGEIKLVGETWNPKLNIPRWDSFELKLYKWDRESKS